MTEIVDELRRLTPAGSDRDLRLQQIHILSNLHDLQQIFQNIMQNISEIIDERKDPFFQSGEKIGFEKGIEKGKEKGRKEGLEKGISVAIAKVLRKFLHFSDKEVADIFPLPIERIAAIRNGLTKTEKP
ncbi:MAG: hypothetical protein ACKVU2_13225 [Saprospiraceae bacterium]